MSYKEQLEVKMGTYDYQLIVIGAGAGGLVLGIGGAKAGKKVLLIDKGTWGGDCTNFGCVPSKSLIAAAHAAHDMRNSESLGLKASVNHFDAKGAFERTRTIVKEIREHEEPDALSKHGVNTLTGKAYFVDPHTLEVDLKEGGTKRVTGDQIIICTGSHPFIPPVEGLEDVPYLTNETVFDLEEAPESLLIFGGGPIGSEMAQAFHRLGSKVTQVQTHKHLLAREELESRELIEQFFRKEGIDLALGFRPQKVWQENGKIHASMKNESGETIEKSATHLLVATGRRASMDGLKLENAGIAHTKKGVIVDRLGRTSQKHIWAAGDITGEAPFTHMAENAARRILFNLLSPWPFKKKAPVPPVVPRVTYTDPEIAAVGMTEEEAIKIYGENKIASYVVHFNEVDRAITTGRTEGLIKVVTKKWSSKILGATIIGPRAGEMLLEISTAMYGNIPLRKLADVIHPYPTYSQGVRKAADKWLSQTILPALKKMVGKS